MPSTIHVLGFLKNNFDPVIDLIHLYIWFLQNGIFFVNLKSQISILNLLLLSISVNELPEYNPPRLCAQFRRAYFKI